MLRNTIGKNITSKHSRGTMMHTHKKSLTDEEGCHCYDGTFPKGKMPPPPILKKIDVSQEQTTNKQKDGIDKAMQILDEYYEGVPLRDPTVDHGGED